MFTKNLHFLLIAIAFSAALPAQNLVKETEKIMSYGNRPAFQIQFISANDQLVEDRWKVFAKDIFGAKVKRDKKTDEWVATNAKSSAVANQTFTIYAKIERSGNDVLFTAWFDMGSYFLNRRDSPGQTNEAVGLLRQFYYDVRRGVVMGDIKSMEDHIKDMEAHQKKLQRDNEQLRRDIENYKAKIKKAEDDVRQNERDQETTVADMENQHKAIEDARKRLENVENERQ